MTPFFELAPPIREENDMVVKRLPGAILERELDDVLPSAGHIASQATLLLRIQE